MVTIHSLDVLLFLFWIQSVVPCLLGLLFLDLHTDFSVGRSGGLVFPSLGRIFQFVVIHTVKGFGIGNKAEVHVFHWFDGCESEWTPGVGDGQGGLACCNSWGRKESDMTEQLNWTEMFFWNFLAFLIIQRMLAIWSLVPLPFLNPAWTSGSSRSTYCWSLAWRILSIILLACEMSIIVW